MTDKMTPQAALDRLETLYSQSVANLRTAVKRFLETGERADPEARAAGLFAYPRLTISWFGDRPQDLEATIIGGRHAAHLLTRIPCHTVGCVP